MSIRLRKRIKHPHELTYSELQELFLTEKLYATVTEKTDGIAFQIGKFDGKVYTRTSNSPKVIKQGQYEANQKIKCMVQGEWFDPWFSRQMDIIHGQFVQTLGKTLVDGEQITGELFWYPFGNMSRDGKMIRFITVPYSCSIIKRNTLIFHSRLSDVIPESNEHFDVHSDSVIRDISMEQYVLKDMFKKINKDLLCSRKKIHTNDRLREINKLQDIRGLFEALLRREVENLGLQPKWGEYTEGYVLHPEIGPRIKLVTDYFKTKKAMEVFNGW